MVVRRIFIVGMCLMSTYGIAMELAKVKEYTGKKIRSFDAAQVLANSSTLGQWNTYSFSSRALAEIIKKDGVVDCHPVVTEEECAMIKSLKKENDERYSLLIEGIYTLLRGPTNDTLQNFKSWAMKHEQDRHDDTQKELESMRGWIAYCDKKERSDEAFWDNPKFPIAILLLMSIEVSINIVIGIMSDKCWS